MDMVQRFTSWVASLWSKPPVVNTSTTPDGLTSRIIDVCEKILSGKVSDFTSHKAELETTWRGLNGRVTPVVRARVKEAAAIAKAEPKILKEIELTDLCDQLILETYRKSPSLSFKELETIGERLKEYLDDSTIEIGSDRSKEIERAAGFLRDVRAKHYSSEKEPSDWLDVHRYNYTRISKSDGPYVLIASTRLTDTQKQSHANEQLRLWNAVSKNPEIDVARKMLEIAQKVPVADRSTELAHMITEITARLAPCGAAPTPTQYPGNILDQSTPRALSGIPSRLNALKGLIKDTTYLTKEGNESLDKSSRSILEEIFMLPKEIQAEHLSAYSELLPFLYEFALKSVIKDTAALFQNVKDEGRVIDAFAKEYETYASYVQFAESHFLAPTDPQKKAVKVIKNHLSEIYRINEQARIAILATAPSGGDLVIKRKIEEVLQKPYKTPVTGKTYEELCRGLPREMRTKIIKKFNGQYQDLTYVSGARFNATWEDGCTAAIKSIEVDQEGVTAPLLIKAETLIAEHITNIETLTSNPNNINLSSLRATRAELRALKAHVSALGGDIEPIDTLITRLSHAETYFIARYEPTETSISSQSQFTLVGQDRNGAREQGNACHACPFIAGYNILNTLNGSKTGNGEELYLGLARQNAMMDTLVHNPRETIPPLTAPDQALPAFHGELMKLTIKRADHTHATDLILEEGKEPEQYKALLKALDAAATQYGKVGAFIRKGVTYYAVTIENQASGTQKISIMDSHGFPPVSETGVPPEFVNRAFDCTFDTLDRAADFLAIRTPYKTPSDQTRNTEVNQCEFYPVILDGQAVIASAAPPSKYTFEETPSPTGTPRMDSAADTVNMDADILSRYREIESTNLQVASSKDLLRFYIELLESPRTTRVTTSTPRQNILAEFARRGIYYTDATPKSKLVEDLAFYDSPELLREAAIVFDSSTPTYSRKTENRIEALKKLIELTTVCEDLPDAERNPIIAKYKTALRDIRLDTPGDTSMAALRKKAQEALANQLASPPPGSVPPP